MLNIKEANELLPLEELDGASIFKHEDSVYMKIDDYCKCDYNAICLETGNLTYFDLTTLVQELDCELITHNKYRIGW